MPSVADNKLASVSALPGRPAAKNPANPEPMIATFGRDGADCPALVCA
ncbi:hypothetical protein [Jatrophihabitans lederbergiae]|uniref:Uncharacterized protein n=1 Tax=Jatrophihabitans lederbergiae TaxID=3075547 RepID=A0ABU2JIH5_9ACTN|nr:hypothetical protein [Jatrophihabitans sp. DSM 44399]MDT0264523.1 hypothetical protein [Jatrophihabitans sp. DSM 44399]